MVAYVVGQILYLLSGNSNNKTRASQTEKYNALIVLCCQCEQKNLCSLYCLAIARKDPFPCTQAGVCPTFQQSPYPPWLWRHFKRPLHSTFNPHSTSFVEVNTLMAELPPVTLTRHFWSLLPARGQGLDGITLVCLGGIAKVSRGGDQRTTNLWSAWEVCLLITWRWSRIFKFWS